MERRDFFVSYTASDADWAKWIAWQLADAGHSVFLQAWDMVPGSNWLYLMNQATMFAQRTIAVLSDAYLTESAFGQAEWLAAYVRDPSGLAGRVIPVRIDDCRVDGLISGIVSVDLAGLPDREAAREVLLDGVKAALTGSSRPLAEPEFPGRSAAAPPDTIAASAGGAVARSDYAAQVRQIAPGTLLDRDAELAAMSAFCTDAAAGSYVWWRAAAWTGKTALMATWVLDPPPQVRVVSFFITARYAGNSDRSAYVEAVNEQLATLLDLAVPPYLTPAGQERLYWSLLSRAAEKCRLDGERLILVVDGLDEDRGVGSDGRSIAALLPADPPAGMRIVIAGRPDPKLPADVTRGHPLRDAGVVWLLRRSEHAAAVRADMIADVARLRDDIPVGRDVLGLVTAAGGGLTSRDLAELGGSEATDWDIERLLSTVAGRSFASRATAWNPGAEQVVYVLGHEEIQEEAARSYGPHGLADYRARLHAWAGSYRASGWPANTPEYLLRGYYRLLLSIGELDRAAGCATDTARHDRMLSLSGGDNLALVEITELQNAVLAEPRPAPALMARLAVQRGRLAARNSRIPAELPEVWALLGETNRAEQLAHGITDPNVRLRALSGLAVVLAGSGDHDRARAAAAGMVKAVAVVSQEDRLPALGVAALTLARIGDNDGAVRFARFLVNGRKVATWPACSGSLGGPRKEQLAEVVVDEAARAAQVLKDPDDTTFVLDRLTAAVLRIGDHGRGRSVNNYARLFSDITTERLSQAEALSEVAVALAATGDLDRAEALARALEDPAARAAGTTRIAAVLAGAGAGAGAGARAEARADRLLGIAESAAESIVGPAGRAEALANVAVVLTRLGHGERSRAVHTRAEAAARSVHGVEARALNSRNLAAALARSGRHDDAERVARAITDPAQRSGALCGIAKVLAMAGSHRDARAMAGRAEQVARSSAVRPVPAAPLARLAVALADAGDYGRAERIAHALTDPLAAVRVWGGIAAALLRAGDEGATAAVGCAERAARSAGEGSEVPDALGELAAVLVEAGAVERAEPVIRSIADPADRAWALADLAVAQARIGCHGRAEQSASEIEEPAARIEALAGISAALHRAGHAERAAAVTGDAERVARYLPHGPNRSRALEFLAVTLAGVGDTTGAKRVADRISWLPKERARADCEIAAALARQGSFEEATSFASRIQGSALRARALASVAVATDAAGDRVRAGALADEAERTVLDMCSPASRSAALSDLVGVFAQAGAGDRAARLAATLARPSARAQALVRIGAVGREDAGAAFATALSLGDWEQLPFERFAEHAPEVLVSLAEAVLPPAVSP